LPVLAPEIVEMLEDRVNCLNDNMMQLRISVKSLQSPLISNENLTTDILLVQDKLKQSELDLHTAETKIETLEASLHLIERRLAMAEDEIEWLTPRPRLASRRLRLASPLPVLSPTLQLLRLIQRARSLALASQKLQLTSRRPASPRLRLTIQRPQ
jgi:chromosome segregation ATPase